MPNRKTLKHVADPVNAVSIGQIHTTESGIDINNLRVVMKNRENELEWT